MLDRVLPFDGVHNFRDYGGYALAGGGRLRAGRLYRSGQYAEASPADIERLKNLRLRAIADLRGPSERRGAAGPDPVALAARVVLVEEETAGLAPHIEAARKVGTAEAAVQAMTAGYAELPFRPTLMTVLRGYLLALAAEDGATLVHCMAGKDRTGFAVALVHALLGVREDELMADYLLTNTAGNLEERIAAGARAMRGSLSSTFDEDTLRVLMGVRAEYLRAALSAVSTRHGGAEGYAREALGVDAATLDALRAKLVE
ncbi:MAG: hypothetical protein AVDCRST_MAG39-1427 [uncultured Sphingomonadaceae bacterium]|uniref:Protein tyrosine phosphatase n=1 Tax=uncultured Sphingomonadaceae bacterium TaxID=169976 RepID=A0A6J4SQP0_9SPHN|nr:MAG: hypothetical protein AVDCRST_MAG39-1427 [uncultured Sphingomonadaceae bacterium]